VINRKGLVRLATYLFCISFDIIILLLFIINLNIPEGHSNAVTFGCVLSLSGLLAGLLINSRAAFSMAGVNCAIVFLAFYTTAQAQSRDSVPIIAFILLIAVVSWLYQRTLNRSYERLSLARQQITRDALLRQELAIARDLQSRLYPPPPEISERFSIASVVLPALETSGDFYDFIELNDEELGIVIADATGKSLAAALVMAMARATFRSEARRATDPAEVLDHANTLLCNDRSVKQMLTAWYGILNTRTLDLRYANAGHPFPLLKRNGSVSELDLPGLPLRAYARTVYESQSVRLEAGDQLLLTSDGVVETMNEARELYGFDRLNNVLNESQTVDADQTIDFICRSLDTFRGPAMQSDDITLVMISIRPLEQ
jgi:serine phosphatase RsbU (regulator of sigma subunit)